MDKNTIRVELKAKVKELHTHSYLTLLSIGQAVSFHLLAENISDNSNIMFPHQISQVHWISWLLAIETFLALILVWNDFFMVVSIFTWIPSLLDATILFLLFASEVCMAKTITDPNNWLISLIFFLFLSLAAFGNTYYQSSRRIENLTLFELSRGRMKASMWMVSGLLALLIVITLLSNTFPWIYSVGIILSLLIIISFTYRTIRHWQRTKAFIDGK
jgi:hypothetical protein